MPDRGHRPLSNLPSADTPRRRHLHAVAVIALVCGGIYGFQFSPMTAASSAQEPTGFGGELGGVHVVDDLEGPPPAIATPPLAADPSTLPPYPLFPQAGALWRDLVINNHVDLGGVTDFDCTNRTYAGHGGHDSDLEGFTHQAAGVPVFAALDGTVIDAHDGEPDQNTVATGQPANYVKLLHGPGHETWYWHLKNGSVGAYVGQVVRTGTQLGLTASSGSSTWPHLHFESRFNGVPFEPSAGPCRAGPSKWVSQIPVVQTPFIRALTMADVPFTGQAELPWDQVTRRGSFVLGTSLVYTRVSLANWPGGDMRVVVKRPDASIGSDFTIPFASPFRTGWFWFTAAPSGALGVTGQWTVEYYINGGLTLTAPFDVVATPANRVNRPPLPVTVTLEPAAPGPADVTVCRVTPDVLFRLDPDYEVVRYRYRWTVNGQVVRDVRSAALSDQLSAGSVPAGGLAVCTVTPYDVPSDTPGPASTSGNAVYSPSLGAPLCSALDSVCDTGQLVVGRGTVAPAEPHQPNTLQGSCADDSTGQFHVQPSLDRLSLSALDGRPFAPGSTVRIDATVWAVGSFNLLDLYGTADATSPTWTHLATVPTPAAGGPVVLSAQYTLPQGRLQAIRGRFRLFGASSPCVPAVPNLAYDDYDDLAFAVGNPVGTTMVQNGAFSAGLANWGVFATPDLSYIVSNTNGGVLQFYRLAAPDPNQAVVLQQTGVAVAADSRLEAHFDLGNSSSVRKRISVLVHDLTFADLAVCTFWLPPNTPLATYAMALNTDQAWSNATISFYAATTGSDGGFYQVDNVSLGTSAGLLVGTSCVDPNAPPSAGAPTSPDLIANGTFTGALTPWTLFGSITGSISPIGVLEFVRPQGSPSGVVLQTTGQPMVAGTVLDATLDLGNSSAVRKRVTLLVHDADFTDLAACTFWLLPDTPLARYEMTMYTTRPWANATVSIYPSTVGLEAATRLDNVTLRRVAAVTPGVVHCIEPSAGSFDPGPPAGGRVEPR